MKNPESTPGENNLRPLRILALLSAALFTWNARADMTAAISDAGTVAVSLDGAWQSALDANNQGEKAGWFDAAHFPTAAARPIQVPGTLNEVWEYHSLKAPAWYLKSFPLNGAPPANTRYYLRFNAVVEACDVWLNGTHLGAHDGGEDPFEFDVTPLLQAGKPNTVAVRVRVSTLAPVLMGGIDQHVALVAQPEVRILDAFARPDTKAGQISLEVTLENNTRKPAEVRVKAALGQYKPAKALRGETATITAAPGQSVAKLTLPVRHPHLWDLNDPFLYTIAVTSNWRPAPGGAALQDTDSFNTGFRDFRVVNGWFYLNGRRIFLRSIHGNWSDPVSMIGTPRNMTYLNKDLPLLKKTGFNVMRFIVSAAMPEQLDQADKLGFMAYTEHETSWMLKDPTKFGLTLNQVVRRDRNHPSLVMWGLLNETSSQDIFHRAKNWLPSLRAIDDTRTVLLSSGRWDGDFKTASISNPGSSTWNVYLGGQDPRNPHTVGYLKGMGDFGDVTGDDHIYPSYPITWDFITRFAKLADDSPRPFFFSESGIGSLYDSLESKRQMELAHAPACSPSWNWINTGVKGIPITWAAYGMGETYPDPRQAFIDSGLESALQRELVFSIIRSNPKVNGYNLTSMYDCWGGAEGIMNDFRELKPGHLAVLQDGWAPLRWCLLVNPMNVYADAPIHVKAALANEDVLPGGDYPATLEISGSSGSVWKQAVVAHVQQNGPMAYILYDEDIRVPGLKDGVYTLTASLDGRANAASNKLAFYVTTHASLPSISGAVTVAGVGQEVRDLLTKQGAQVHDYAPGEQIDHETILVGSEFKGKAVDWRALYARAARGAHIVFLNNHVFRDGSRQSKWLALPVKGDQDDDPDWLYHKDIFGKVNQPILAGLQPKLMSPEFYGQLLGHTSNFRYMTNPAAADTVAISIYSEFGNGYRDGLMLATYPFHAGHFTINAFNIAGTMGCPATDRLVVNLVRNAQADAAPLAPLPAGYDAEMDGLGFKD